MLTTIQIITLLQGVFLLFVLFKNKAKYRRITFWLFSLSIVSILLFIIGDDDNNLFREQANWFLFDASLFITFLFLFFRYYKSGKEVFDRKDLLFFIPNLLYFTIEIIEKIGLEGHVFLEAAEFVVELSFLSYLVYMLYDLFKNKSNNWILYTAIPIVLILSLKYINEFLMPIGKEPIFNLNNSDFSSYLLIVMAFLFYVITFYFITSPKELLPTEKQKKYKTSNLNDKLIERHKTALISAMEKDKLYTDPKLSIHKLSEELQIPRQYISEVLNLHLEKSFLDFINEYRVEEFIKRLKDDQYAHLTLLGIANEVGFNSKSTFNATFKKIKGITPSEYKNSLQQNVQ
ncbi:helix-turn-helix domain-containing protein [Mangrovimonas xylaniphaga]|uniref:helix-turn-helix domain-containing protein n=1 Tax=Mangrovimonas xylaniphaga TaxID=1645915 RepID=UPI0006B44C23|nr:helix-turn-helix domain-containing protein [Mangrovimonas xylaniphaga]